jgi:hypothetical protein
VATAPEKSPTYLHDSGDHGEMRAFGEMQVRADALGVPGVGGPDECLTNDYARTVERRDGRSVEAIAECDRVADPVAEGVVIGPGQQPVARQIVGGRVSHVGIVSARLDGGRGHQPRRARSRYPL